MASVRDMAGTDTDVIARLTRFGGAAPLGVFISSIDPTTSEIAGDAGFDFTLIDGEHGPLDRQAVLNHVRAAEAAGMTSLVRGLESSNSFIQSMLDLGVAGVVVPKLESAEEARRVVRASRYAPEGTRGMCPACHDGRYTVDGFANHMRTRNRQAMVIPIIETIKGVSNIDEIVAVDGMDLIHFGPGDLSAEMALDLAKDMDQLQDPWRRVRDAAHAAGKKTLATHPEVFLGADAYLVPMELMLLREALTKIVGEYRSAWGVRHVEQGSAASQAGVA